MLTTQYVHGAPNWLDLSTSDTGSAAAFYGELLGWSFRSAGPESGGYGFFQLDGKTVAALSPSHDGAPPTWNLYFHTPDADTTVKAVEQAGGTVRMAPDDVFTQGRMAACTDPGGADFSLWQPGDLKGLDLVTEPGSLAWAELYVADPDAVSPFYADVFGWTIEHTPFGDLTYIVASASEGTDPSLAGLLPLQPGDTPHWLPYLEVPDCDATLLLAQQLGARVTVPAIGAEGIGRFAELTDPQGARFAIITSATP
ncbi:VOC family protein [Sphaerisporangium sp. TRM90804]|uniref:VOC family protein n=1 Tax=Sphaerisporangium sp. TRM90804 TaxID=3031113 RepID=UPI00244C3B6E|nr:VOC family protein [Sphaerisporangium sp. TRM90804]MDH2426331.1 VOC family protein [Sphaerisporangium sp. TRM90804]